MATVYDEMVALLEAQQEAQLGMKKAQLLGAFMPGRLRAAREEEILGAQKRIAGAESVRNTRAKNRERSEEAQRRSGADVNVPIPTIEAEPQRSSSTISPNARNILDSLVGGTGGGPQTVQPDGPGGDSIALQAGERGTLTTQEEVPFTNQPFSGSGRAGGLLAGLANMAFTGLGGPEALGRNRNVTQVDVDLRDRVITGLSASFRNHEVSRSRESALALTQGINDARLTLGRLAPGAIRTARIQAGVNRFNERMANTQNANNLMVELGKTGEFTGSQIGKIGDAVRRGDHEGLEEAMTEAAGDIHSRNAEDRKKRQAALDAQIRVYETRADLNAAQLAKMNREEKEMQAKVSIADVLGGPSFGGLTPDQLSKKTASMLDDDGFPTKKAISQVPMLQGEYDRQGQVLVLMEKEPQAGGIVDSLANRFGGTPVGRGFVSFERIKLIQALGVIFQEAENEGTFNQKTVVDAANFLSLLGGMYPMDKFIVKNDKGEPEIDMDKISEVGAGIATRDVTNPNATWANLYAQYVRSILKQNRSIQ